MKKSSVRFSLLGASCLVAASNINCSGGFSSSQVPAMNDKSSLVSPPLFTNNQPPPPATNVISAAPVSVAPKFELPVSTFHSDNGTSTFGGNVISARKIDAIFTDLAGRDQCTISSDSIRDDLINRQAVIINDVGSACPQLQPGKYSLRLVAPGTRNLLIGESAQDTFNNRQAIQSGNYPNFSTNVLKDTSGKMQIANAMGIAPTVLYSKRLNLAAGVTCPPPGGGGNNPMPPSSNDPTGSITVPTPTGTPPPGAPAAPEVCSVNSGSPLLIQIHRGDARPRPIELTTPLQGVMFDLLGENSYPSPHTKHRMSWFTSQMASGNYFLVLPNSSGQIGGVDEMFGNNTAGPDGKFAANGYEALRKWDGRKANGSYDNAHRDGVITSADLVFSRLRLWEDLNADGIAQASELHTLGEIGVTSISLDYDANYNETDLYGNQIRMKSSAQTSDGLQHVMFDIWFRPLPNE